MTAAAIAGPIDDGRRLVSEGRLLEALPHLTRANREHLHRTANAPEMSEARYAIESWFFAPPS